MSDTAATRASVEHQGRPFAEGEWDLLLHEIWHNRPGDPTPHVHLPTLLGALAAIGKGLGHPDETARRALREYHQQVTR